MQKLKTDLNKIPEIEKQMTIDEFSERCRAFNEAQGMDISHFSVCPVHLWSMNQHNACLKNSAGVHYCKLCGEPMCSCGNHVVTILSRTTGYISAAYTAGQPAWNHGKLAELRDRRRYVL